MTGDYKLTQLHPIWREWVQNVMRALESVGVGGQVYDVFRSGIEQDRRFSLGDTKARAGQSPHQYGLAFDFVVKQGERSDYQKRVQEFWRLLGCGVISWDPAHVEHPGWKEIARSMGAKI